MVDKGRRTVVQTNRMRVQTLVALCVRRAHERSAQAPVRASERQTEREKLRAFARARKPNNNNQRAVCQCCATLAALDGATARSVGAQTPIQSVFSHR